jgi:hypothetical protein
MPRVPDLLRRVRRIEAALGLQKRDSPAGEPQSP